ncbi:MAG: hypothetical protein R3322_23645, partial [Kiloniellales bacterium]|nr:hypothetical protein [Kiloniellales bacterium]
TTIMVRAMVPKRRTMKTNMATTLFGVTRRRYPAALPGGVTRHTAGSTARPPAAHGLGPGEARASQSET